MQEIDCLRIGEHNRGRRQTEHGEIAGLAEVGMSFGCGARFLSWLENRQGVNHQGTTRVSLSPGGSVPEVQRSLSGCLFKQLSIKTRLHKE